MVVELRLDADVVQRHRHVGPQVLVVVHRRGGEVALLGAGLVAEVRALVRAGVPLALDRVDPVHAAVRRGLEPHVVEDEELGLGAEVRGVGHPGGEEVLLRLLGDVARVAAVPLARDRIGDVAVHDERLPASERVQVGGGGVGDEDHVRLLDLLEAAHGRAVEGVAVLELALVEHPGGDRHVLHHPRQVAEAQVDELDALRVDQLQHLVGGSLFHGADRRAPGSRGAAALRCCRWTTRPSSAPCARPPSAPASTTTSWPAIRRWPTRPPSARRTATRWRTRPTASWSSARPIRLGSRPAWCWRPPGST